MFVFEGFGQTRPSGDPPTIFWGPPAQDLNTYISYISRLSSEWATYFWANPSIAQGYFKQYAGIVGITPMTSPVSPMIAILPTSAVSTTPLTTPSVSLAGFNLSWPILGILGIGLFLAMRGGKKKTLGRRRRQRNPCRRR